MKLVSVVMSAFNAELYIREAIDSIICQTYSKFEFIIIDDGSTDNTKKIIESYDDKRIRFISNSKNKGLIYSLNFAVNISNGEYIIRMDADDIALPDRIKKQVNYMESNNEILVSGGNAIFFSGDKILRQTSLPITHDDIKNLSFVQSPFIHPTVIIRKSVFEKYCYEEKYLGAEDYALWVNVIADGLVANLNDILIKYRVLETSVTRVEERNLLRRYDIINSIHWLLLIKYKIDKVDSKVLTLLSNINFSKIKEKQLLSSYMSKNLEEIFTCYKDVRLKSLLCKRYFLYCIASRSVDINWMSFIGFWSFINELMLKGLKCHTKK